MTRALVLLAFAALIGCRADSSSETAPAEIVERSRVSMGSEVHLTAWTADERAATAAFEAVFDEFDRLDALMSVWKEGSDIERLNRAAGEKAVPVSPEVREVLSMARQASEWTRREVRRHVRRAVGTLEVRPRSRRQHSGARRRPRAPAAHRLPASSRWTTGEGHGLPHGRRACARTLAASARATPSIAPRRSCAGAASTTS